MGKMDREQQRRIRDALYERLLKTPEELRGPIIKLILYLELGFGFGEVVDG